MKELLASKYALIEFECDHTLSLVETRCIIPPKGKLFSYDVKFTVGLKNVASSGSKTRNLGCSIILLSNEKEYLQGILEDYENGTLSIEEIEMKREIAEEEDQVEGDDESSTSTSRSKTSSQRVSQRNRKGKKKDDQFEYEDMPSTSKKNKQEPAIPSETSKKKNAGSMLATKRANQNLLEQIKKDRVIGNSSHASVKKSTTANKEKGDCHVDESSFCTSTQNLPSQSCPRDVMAYDDYAQSLLLSSGGTRNLEPQKEGSESESSEKDDDYAAAGFSQHIDTDPLDVTTVEKNEGMKRKFAEIVAENVQLKKKVANLQAELAVLHMIPTVVDTVNDLLLHCNNHLNTHSINGSSLCREKIIKKRPDQSMTCDDGTDGAGDLYIEDSDSSSSDDLQDDPACSKEGAFPIKKEFVESLPKTGCKQFTLDLMGGLYSRRYLIMHKMTDREATIGSSSKLAMKKYELDQIMEVLDEQFPGVSKREKHEAIRQKFNQNRKRKKRSNNAYHKSKKRMEES